MKMYENFTDSRVSCLMTLIIKMSLQDSYLSLSLSPLAVIMEKFKEIKETNIVSIANVKLQEHRN